MSQSTDESKHVIHVLFVCLGNICRSPLAEGIFQSLVDSKGLSEKIHCDSAGTTGYHQGDEADPRMKATTAKHGIYLNSISRQVKNTDFFDFDYVVAMDKSNLQQLQYLSSRVLDAEFEFFLMRDFDNEQSGADVQDPYYLPDKGFDDCFQIVKESCENFLAYLVKRHSLSS